MAGQPETTRLEWERTGPFVPFEVARSRTQHVPEEYLKNAHWGIVDGDKSYHVRSLVEGDEHWYPVEFISDRACWVEIRCVTISDLAIFNFFPYYMTWLQGVTYVADTCLLTIRPGGSHMTPPVFY